MLTCVCKLTQAFLHACRAKLSYMQQQGQSAADLCHLIMPMGGNLLTLSRPDFFSLLKSLVRIW